MDEYKIVEEKDPVKEKYRARLEAIENARKADKTARQALSRIDLLVGILMQTRGYVNMDHNIATDIEGYLKDMVAVSKELVMHMNKKMEGENDD